MRVVLTDGEELSCTNFKALDGGVLLTKDKKRKKVVGYVPNHQLRYVVDEDVLVTPAAEASAEEAAPAAETSDVDTFEAEAPESDLKRLGGLGTTYAERLQSAGYDSVAALAEADPVAVAEAASVAPGRGRRWVDAAERMTAASNESTESGDEVDTDEGEGGDEIDSDERDEGDEAGDSDEVDTDETSDSDEVDTDEASDLDEVDTDEASDSNN